MKKTGMFSVVVLLFLSACGGANNPDNGSADSTDTVHTTLDTLKTEVTATDPKKEEILRKLIGEHKLVAIEANMGANTMADYTLEGGEWSASGSAIQNFEREGYGIDLSEEDIEKLNSAKIVVTEDLSIYYSCMGNQYFNAPFNASGMTYLLKTNPEDFIGTIPPELSKNTTFINDDLYLYAEDQIEEEAMDPIDIVQVWADAVLIKYSSSGSLEMSLFYGDCCDNSTYFFE